RPPRREPPGRRRRRDAARQARDAGAGHGRAQPPPPGHPAGAGSPAAVQRRGRPPRARGDAAVERAQARPPPREVLVRALAAAALLLLALPALAADVEQTARDSYGAYLQGRYDDAASGFRYLQTLNVSAPQPEANEALVQRDGGHPEAALPLWIKASLLENADGFIWNQRGWTFLALGRERDAKESFQRAIDRSSTTAMQAEANLGLGLEALIDGKPKAGVDALRRAGISGPYAIAVSAQLTAETSAALGDKERALSYLRQSLDVDPYNREALRSLVSLLDKIGDNRGAWLTARRELALDPTDEAALKVLKRNAPYIQGDP